MVNAQPAIAFDSCTDLHEHSGTEHQNNTSGVFMLL